MKKVITFLLCVCCLAGCATAEPWRVFDNAGLFTEDEISTIEQAISDFQRKTNNDFVVLTMDDYFGVYSSDDIAMEFYDSNNFGFGKNASGVIYYFHIRNDMLYANYGMHGEMCTIWGDEIKSFASDACRQLIHSGKSKEAILTLIEYATKAVEVYKNGIDIL